MRVIRLTQPLSVLIVNKVSSNKPSNHIQNIENAKVSILVDYICHMFDIRIIGWLKVVEPDNYNFHKKLHHLH